MGSGVGARGAGEDPRARARVGALVGDDDRRRQRHGARRRLRDRDGLRRAPGGPVGLLRPAGDQSRDHPGLRRHPAAGAAGRRGEGAGDEHDRRADLGRGGLRVRPRQSRRPGPRTVRHRPGLGPQVRRPGAGRAAADQAGLERRRPRRGSRRGARRVPEGVHVRGRARGDRRVHPEAEAAIQGEVTTGTARLAELIRSYQPVVALTGAGISVPSGIPDFRTPLTGLWANVDPMEVAHITVWQRDPARFWGFYGQRFAALDGKQPNGAHLALAELERRGLLAGGVTPNIDGVHAAAGNPDPNKGHRSVRPASCLSCGMRVSLAETRTRMALDEEGVPRCDCGRPLKPDVVLFGEMLPADAMERAQALADGAGLMLVVGSSLEVYPVAGLPADTLARGGRLAIVTRSSTPYDREASVRLSGDVVDELSAVVAAL